MDDEEKQKVFEIMFKLETTSSEENCDRLNSAKSASSLSIVPCNDEKGKKYSTHTKRNKIAATKYFLQEVLGKKIVPIASFIMLILYILAVFVHVV